ncbi:uncharacterized protein BcabD6B2_54220 [Babesia caballi]|uniref:Response regulatory domain-containing protein n=1 Tax=Babesia caballi TaxID=5871 RepID=A0AAV4M0J6_BABCB|nr:hypothetical protein, conserved [Babesia caballi]
MGADDLLKKPPQNLKEAIDWILWFWDYGGHGSGMGNYTKLANALNTLSEFQDAKNQALGRIEPSCVINTLANKLRDFVGHMSQGGTEFSGHGIIKKGNTYTSKYQDATWNGSESDTDMARIFLCASAMAFWGLSFLYWRCKQTPGGWATDRFTDSQKGLQNFMSNMGYELAYLNKSTTGQEIAKLLEDG